MGSYEVSVGAEVKPAETFQGAGVIVMEAVTSLLAQDPDGAAEGAMMANRAFTAGAVQDAVDTHGVWRMSITVHGESIPIVVAKK